MSASLSKTDTARKKSIFFIISAVILALLIVFRFVIAGSEKSAFINILGFSAEDGMLLGYFKTGVALAEFIIVDCAVYTVLFAHIRWHRFFTVFTLCFGLLFLFTITPLSVPDEITHFQTVLGISCDVLGREVGSSFTDFSGFANHSNVSTGYLRILHELGGRAEIEEASFHLGNTISGMWTLTYIAEYVPQLIGVSLGLLLGRNMVTCFMLGRFFNLLFYCLCVYIAIKRTPRFKVLFGLAALMPMALQQSASMSYDSFIDALSILLISSLMYSVLSEHGFSFKELLYILIPAALLAPAKGVYSLFVLLFLFVPKKRFESSKIKRLPAFFIILGCCAFLFAAVSIPSVIRIMNGTRPGFEVTGDCCYKASYLITDPLDSFKIFADTFNAYILDWLAGAIGSSLSTYTMNIPVWIVPFYALCLALSVQNRTDRSITFPAGLRLALVLISAFVIFAFMMTMFLTWIRDTDKIIIGVQGRYFIPIIPLLALSLNNKLVELKHNIHKPLTITAVLLVARVILYVVSQTMSASV